MRIGLVTACYWPVVNGVTRMVDMYSAHLAKAGHEVTIFTLGNSVYASDGPAVIASAALPLGRSGYHLGLRYSKQARSLLRRMDIVHCHHLLMGLEFAQRYSPCPIVFTNHTRYDLYASAYAPLSQPAADNVMRRLWPAMTKGCDVVIAPAPSMRKTLRDFGVRQRIEVIENGVDLKQMRNPASPRRKADFGFPEHGVLLTYVGRLSVEKEVLKLLSQFATAARAIAALRLLLVGDGPLRGRLESHVWEQGLGDKVYFAGQVPGNEVPDYLAAADLFVTASKSEVHPLTVIEALASGLPIIAYRSPGISETVASGLTGLLVGQGEELTRPITLLSRESALRSKMADAAARSASRYDIESTVRRTLAIYEELRGKSAGPQMTGRSDRKSSIRDRGYATAWLRRFRTWQAARGH
jgi:1,2-diacylglycerol 3-alpha-glucosyltransferase